MALKIKVTQVRSGIGRPETQRQTLRGLGLRKPHSTAIVEVVPELAGEKGRMIHPPPLPSIPI